MFEEFYEVNRNIANQIKQLKRKTGKKIIGVMPEYFPSEVITALDAYPVYYRGTHTPISKADTYLQSFSCTTTRTILEQALNGEMDDVDAFVFTTMCDNQQNLAEAFKRLFPSKPVIIFLIPFTSSIPIRQQHLKEQLDSAIGKLEEVTGNRFTMDAFKKAISMHERYNSIVNKLYEIRRNNPVALSSYEFYNVLKAGSVLPVEDFIKMLEPVLSQLEKKAVQPVEHRVIISGITPEPIDLLKVFDELEMYIVDDDMTNGTRHYSKGVLKGIEPVDIDNFVFGGSPCSTLFNPAKDRREYLAEKAKANKAGVVLWQIKFCEPEAFERPDLMNYLKQQGIQVTSFEVELQMSSFEGIKTRLQAFKEIM
ncbi:MAG: 2-hydroxyacyl-CoA dehydratase subunit D [bacterium]